MASRNLHVIGVLALAAACPPVWGQNVKITPLGSHAGELCSRDRATIFEDPTGVRILYDAGQSVTGADDARLGAIDVVPAFGPAEAGSFVQARSPVSAPVTTQASIVALHWTRHCRRREIAWAGWRESATSERTSSSRIGPMVLALGPYGQSR